MINKRIYKILNKNFLLKKNNKNLDLFKEGIIDSFGIFKLIDHLEKEFKVKINLDKFSHNNLRSIKSISRFLKKIN